MISLFQEKPTICCHESCFTAGFIAVYYASLTNRDVDTTVAYLRVSFHNQVQVMMHSGC